MSASVATVNHFYLADLGQVADPSFIYFLVFCGGVIVVAGFSAVLGLPGTRTTFSLAAVVVSLLVLLSLARSDYADSQLYHAPAVPFGVVASASTTGGGCTTTRTNIVFKNGDGVSVLGEFSVLPGARVTRKSISSGDYVCRGDGNTIDCTSL